MKVLLFVTGSLEVPHPEVKLAVVPAIGDRLFHGTNLYAVKGRVFYPDDNTVVLRVEPTSTWWDAVVAK